MDITHLSIDQLKSLAYDTKKEIERHEQNLAVIEQQLSLKVQAEAEQAAQAAAENEAKAAEQGDQPGSDNGGEKVEVKTGDQGTDTPPEA